MDDIKFEDLGLSPEVMEAVKKAGYETPSPIQAKAIPPMLRGENILGTAQTGTGKTAAFTLPLLSRLDFSGKNTAMLVLSPTRELAIQVAEAVQQYACAMPRIHVVPVYGGQDIGVQFRALKRTAQIIIATPGRLIDHLDRGSIDLSHVQAVVLDEADEMLDMGFMEDVERILSEIPKEAQRALFSATMPTSVKKIIDKHLGSYTEALIIEKTATVEKVRQRYLIVRQDQKIEALSRVLEGENIDGVLIFVRTKQETAEVAERLEARGFEAAPLSGDLAQSLRERTINRLKTGKIDIVVATDVAARGLDVDRITHVVNYDSPYDTESYVHRIGRTGRAGRDGNAILFITPRERNLLRMIERATRQPIEQMDTPTGAQISERRVTAFRDKIKQTLENEKLEDFRALLEKIQNEETFELTDIAAALMFLAQKGQPLFPELPPLEDAVRERVMRRKFDSEKDFGLARDDGEERPRHDRKEADNGVEEGFERYYMGVGRFQHVSPRDIVGAIAGESGMNSSDIGRIKLFDRFSTVELPQGLSEDILHILQSMSIRNYPSKFRLMTDEPPERGEGDDSFGDRGDFGGAGRRRGGFRGGNRDGDRPFRPSHGGGKPFHGGFGGGRDGDKPFRKTRRFGRH